MNNKVLIGIAVIVTVAIIGFYLRGRKKDAADMSVAEIMREYGMDENQARAMKEGKTYKQ